MRILVADPDKTRRRRLAERLAALADVTISDLCSDLTETFNAVEHRPPTLALLAEELTRRPEFEMMEILFRTLSVRWTALAARPGAPGLDPEGDDATLAEGLRRCLVGGRLPPPAAGAGLLRAVDPSGADRLILIGSSTGGVDALLRVLGSFPADCPPTLVVQHTGAAYSAGLARLLDRNVVPDVREAAEGEVPAFGRILIAPGAEAHLVLENATSLRCRLKAGDRLSGHRPSVDALFHSAVPVARRVTAALLTGMGRDGAEGLLALRQAGARTIGQDRATSVVYGMPGAARDLDAVDQELPLSAIGPALLKATQRIRA
ncbi:CheB methylesterase domain-containing protein [Pararhodobacter aggregans]|uniref:protein-glutamate methylesterase n=1 Tax=Pararhodobacter aggregans TaxID=404875 RepID=A0A2T7USF0_9RHOB|nr:CheB methylesterase domain-containing protein [Pararhodobacter aggregans]PTX00192.1 two-component system chemotaxis response regulator CheB [Pararhodobacter aggregans]PVE47518.1 chemotaxis protein CheB [Pararhodobacter aggregans]